MLFQSQAARNTEVMIMVSTSRFPIVGPVYSTQSTKYEHMNGPLKEIRLDVA